MPLKLAIVGLDAVDREWFAAVETLRVAGEIDLVGVGHRSLNLAKDMADQFPSARPEAFDDLRLLLQNTGPQVLLMDRPSNVGVDFLTACVSQKIGVLSLGPPVENFAEAQALSETLEPRTHLLYVWPRLADSPAYRHCTQAEEFVRPIRFASATWLGMNHALAKTAGADGGSGKGGCGMPVRSLSVLAWDAFATLIDLFDTPTSVYASLRGAASGGDSFADISGACALTLRFAGDGVASLTISDRVPGKGRQDILLLGQEGSVRIEAGAYEFRDSAGKLIDAGKEDGADGGKGAETVAGAAALDTLREFLGQFVQPASPSRGWNHRLEPIAAAMEAMVVSHRTGQAESPERFRGLRR